LCPGMPLLPLVLNSRIAASLALVGDTPFARSCQRCLLCCCCCCCAACPLPPCPGKGLDLVRMFYSLLPQRHRWVEAQGQAAEFIIDETFGVPGVGTVVAGAHVKLGGGTSMHSAATGSRHVSALC
jgi:hypothetical protein